MKKRLIGLLLVLCMVASLFTVGIRPAAVADEITQSIVQGGTILHCFDWSYNEIRANLSAIKAAGYTAVQTSPVQPAKDYNKSWNDTKGQWWKLYQPLDLRVANGTETWLGSPAELTALCAEAHQQGLYVIVDIVANHTANISSGGYTKNGTYNVSPQVAERLQDPNGSKNLYHTSESDATDANRTTMTQNHISMPDLNTGNQVVQDMVYDLLVECVDCGVDGFRFDAAKHIELPTDSGCASDFWPDVLGRIRSYANKDLFVYGEELYTTTSGYMQYMAMTDNVTGNNVRTNVANGNASGLAASGYNRGSTPRNYVIWAESHDTYEADESSGVSSDKIVKTWAIVGARAESTALFLARPNELMGMASTDTSWKSAAVAAVNKFKTYFNGSGESLRSNSTTAWIERGTSGSAGVVIDKLDGAGWVSLTTGWMSNGTYADEVTGNIFTVSNGTISGYVGPTGVAVVYKTSTGTAPTPPPATPTPSTPASNTLYLQPNSNWKTDNARFAMYFFNGSNNTWVSMTDSDNDGVYEGTIPSGTWPNVIFCRMDPGTTANNWDNKWNQTNDLTVPTNGNNLYTVAANTWDKGGGTWSVFGGGSGSNPTPTPIVTADEGYYLIGTMTGWSVLPDYKMTRTSATTEEYTVDVPLIRTTFPVYNSKFKVVYSPDGVTKDKWFPEGDDNDYGYTASDIPMSGIYTVYFRPNYDGEDDWKCYKCLNAERTKYFVTVNDADKNGTVTVNKSTAASGETVTVTVVPNAGYQLDTLVYMCETALGSGVFNETAITGSTFLMPSENAVVKATFTEDGTSTPTPTATQTATPTPTPTPTSSTPATPTPTPATTRTLYLKPNSNWKTDGARFAMYFFNGSNNTWVSMTDSDNDGVYEGEIPSGTWPNVIFCRMNGNTTANNWDNKWNQTGDLTVPTDGSNMFTLAEGSWDGATETWSVFDDGSGNTLENGYYLVDAANPTIENVDPALKLELFTGIDANGHVFNDSDQNYVLTRNFGAHTYQVVCVRNDALVPVSNSCGTEPPHPEHPIVETYGGGLETVWFSGTYYPNNNDPIVLFDENAVGSSSLTGYYLVISLTPVPGITADCQLVETAAGSGLYYCDQEFSSGMSIKAVQLQNGLLIAQYPGDGSNKNLVTPEYPEDANHPLPTRVYFRPDGQGGTGWFNGYLFDTPMAPKDTEKHNLTLQDDISVVFSVILPKIDGVDYSTSYVTFEIEGRGANSLAVTRVDYADMTKTDVNDYAQKASFRCKVNVLQMAEWIKPVFHYGSNQTLEMQWYCVRSYCENWHFAKDVNGNTGLEAYPTLLQKTDALVQALANYGYHAQRFLESISDWTLCDFDSGDHPNAYAIMDLSCYNREYSWSQQERYYTKDYTASDYTTIANELNSANNVFGANQVVDRTYNSDISSITYSVTLDSKTVINLYFYTVAGYDGTVTVSVDGGDPVQATQVAANKWMVQITNVKASQLGNLHTVTATTANDTTQATVSISAMSYVYTILTSSAYADNALAKNAVSALYDYAKAAKLLTTN